MRSRYSTDRLILAVAGLAGATLGLLDLFGILDIPFLQKNLSKLTLLLVGLSLTLLATTALTQVSRTASKVDENRAIDVEMFKDVLVQIERLRTAIDRSAVERLPELIERVDPAMLAVFRPYLEETFRTPPRVLLEKRFRLLSLETYRSYHRRTLEENPAATFYATSLPFRKWFWRSDDIERAIGHFIAGGGRLVRVFFLPDSETLSNQEAQEVMATQNRLGVEVLTLEASRVPPDLRRFFFVEEGGRLAWEAVRGPDDEVASIEVTADRHDIEGYLMRFEQLRRVSTRYRPGVYLSKQIGANEGNLVNISKDPNSFLEFEYSGWQSSVERYHSAWGALTSQTAKPMLDALGVDAGVAFLDVASGPGYIADAARVRGAAAVALDFSPAMIDKGRTAFPELSFKQGDAQRLPFPDQSFDAVGMNFGILHLGEPERAIREAYRVLRPGGRFGFTIWSRPNEALGFSVILKAVENHGEPVSLPHGPDFFYYSRPEECKVALTTVGFSGASVSLLDLEWSLPGADHVFPSFFEGTARTGGLLRQQRIESRRLIQQEATELARRFTTDSGHVSIPMPALLATGTKH